MTPGGAQRTVIGSLVVTGGLVTARELSHGALPSIRVGLGLGVAGLCLSFIAQGSPELGGSLALLFLVASILTIGGDVFTSLRKALGQ